MTHEVKKKLFTLFTNCLASKSFLDQLDLMKAYKASPAWQKQLLADGSTSYKVYVNEVEYGSRITVNQVEVVDVNTEEEAWYFNKLMKEYSFDEMPEPMPF